MDQVLTARSVQERLGLGEAATAWLGDLEQAEASDSPVTLPPPNEARALLERLAVPRTQITGIIDTLPALEREPALWWLLTRCHHLLVREMGGFDPLRRWPSLPPELGPVARYFYVWVFLATLDDVRRYHAARGIPDDVSWATLADLGRNMAIHERIYGAGGLDEQNWLTLHWRGGIYQLGRLQFNRGRIRYDAATIEQLGLDFRHGDPSLGVHIPEAGPLSPDACDASFRQAPHFFARHFPEETYRIATCGSWLLDEQLAEYLPPASNIIRFQRRFRIMPGGWLADREIVRFVFRRDTTRFDELPRRTTLERAIVQHLLAGRHWYSRSGWLTL